MITTNRIIDISIPLNKHTPTYSGDPAFSKERIAAALTNGYNLHRLSMSTHSGTHVDAPYHLFDSGKRVSDFPATHFIRPAHVVDVQGFEQIEAEHLMKHLIMPGDAVLFRTKSPASGITTKCADRLVELGVSIAGIDNSSIEHGSGTVYPVHNVLLSHDILILEQLRLDDVLPGRYTLIALPLPLADTDGAPVRAVLMV
jgi:arylformamidase